MCISNQTATVRGSCVLGFSALKFIESICFTYKLYASLSELRISKVYGLFVRHMFVKVYFLIHIIA